MKVLRYLFAFSCIVECEGQEKWLWLYTVKKTHKLTTATAAITVAAMAADRITIATVCFVKKATYLQTLMSNIKKQLQFLTASGQA